MQLMSHGQTEKYVKEQFKPIDQPGFTIILRLMPIIALVLCMIMVRGDGEAPEARIFDGTKS